MSDDEIIEATAILEQAEEEEFRAQAGRMDELTEAILSDEVGS